MRAIDLTGQQFGRLTVLRFQKSTGTKRWWLCLCACGRESTVCTNSLRNGTTKSCGCLHLEVLARGNFKHGYSNRPGTAYNIWKGMLRRCGSPGHAEYHLYGGRGIRVCEKWQDFRNFLADMGDRPDGHSIDRINNDGNYEPDNCRWATSRTQARNTRRNRWFSFGGKTMVLKDWARYFGKNDSTLIERLQKASFEVVAAEYCQLGEPL